MIELTQCTSDDAMDGKLLDPTDENGQLEEKYRDNSTIGQ